MSMKSRNVLATTTRAGSAALTESTKRTERVQREHSQTQSTDAREFWLTEYRLVIDQFHKYYDIHVKAFGVFLGINGLLFRYALDSEFTKYRILMVVMGVVFSITYSVPH